MDLKKITSRDNDRLKYVRKVRDGRVENKLFLEGVRLVAEALRSRTPIDAIFFSSGAGPRVQDLIDLAGASVTYEVSEQVFQSIVDTTTAQGLIAIGERPATEPAEIERRLEGSAIPVVVFLDRINNPSNLGAVIRTAEAAGAAGVIVSEGSAGAFSPKALRAAMGSSLRLAIWDGVEFDEAMEWAKGAGLRAAAADIDGAITYTDIDWRRPRMLIVGSEASGLSYEDRERVDELIIIPMENKVESLNLAVACGIVLFEAKRQVRSP